MERATFTMKNELDWEHLVSALRTSCLTYFIRGNDITILGGPAIEVVEAYLMNNDIDIIEVKSE